MPSLPMKASKIIYRCALPLLLLLASFCLSAQERVYVHTDASHYFQGERIWMKAYVVDPGLCPTDSSLYVYAELVKDGGMVEKRIKMIRNYGVFSGYFDVPEYLESGVYYLCAYTMATGGNGGARFVRPLAIGRASLPVSAEEASLVADTDTCAVRLNIGLKEGAYQVHISSSDMHPGEVADVSVSVSLLGRGRVVQAGITDYFSKTLYAPPTDAGYAFESGQTIKGRVLTTIGRKGVGDVRVAIISPQSGMFSQTVSDASGRFSFTGMDYPEGNDFVLQCRDSKGRNRYRLEVEEMVYPSCDGIKEKSRWAEIPSLDIPLADFEVSDGSTLLTAATVSTMVERDPPETGFGKQSDFSFGPRQIEEMGATCLHEVLRRVPGVFIRNEVCYIRAATSIYGDNPAAIAIDGVIVDGEFDLDIINMPDVERVDVFLTGNTVIWGTKGGSGVISITTKKGDYLSVNTQDLPNVKKVHPLGWQVQPSFSQWLEQNPSSRTLLWIPMISNPSFTFPKLPGQAPCLITVEGVTSEGRLIHETRMLE